MPPPRVRPIEKFAAAVASCTKEVCFTTNPYLFTVSDFLQSTAYGKCIVVDYNNVSKDKCLTEFLKLQQCYTVSPIKFVDYSLLMGNEGCV
jgi:hypothetical protein